MKNAWFLSFPFVNSSLAHKVWIKGHLLYCEFDVNMKRTGKRGLANANSQITGSPFVEICKWQV